MKKLKYLFIILATVMLSASCSDDGNDNDNYNGLIGSWEETQWDEDLWTKWTFTFNSNGTGTISAAANTPDDGNGDDFTWGTEGDQLTLVINEDTEKAIYSISGNKLTINFDEGEFVLTRK